MRGLPIIKIISSIIIVLLFSLKSFAQEGTVSIEQDAKIEKLLKERKKLLMKGQLKKHHTIQVFSGELENAQKTLKDCKNNFPDYKSQIIYETPNYKVWIGEFRNRIDADSALLNISEEYNGAFVFEPEGKK